MTHTCIGTKRGTNYGVVYSPHGSIVGRVRRESKDAAGTYRNRRPEKWAFYTAALLLANGDPVRAPSLGTRHETRAHAMRAIRMFWVWWSEQDSAPAIPRAYHVQQFKFEHREVCALDASPMVRVAHPSSLVPRAA